MSLLHPTMGEMLDRLTVLRLKLMRCGNRADFPHLEDESIELQEAIAKRFTDKTEWVISQFLDDLSSVHHELWDLVQTDSSPALLAANRRRWEIREAIDKATGEYQGQEKV